MENPGTDMNHTDCNASSQKGKPFLRRVWELYYDGFRSMTVGKTLWLIIGIKLFLFFIVMKLLFFPNILNRDFDTDEQRADHVRQELTGKR